MTILALWGGTQQAAAGDRPGGRSVLFTLVAGTQWRNVMASAVGDIWETAIALRDGAEVGEVVVHHKVKTVTDTDTQDVAEAHLSAIAEAVQEILTVANRNVTVCYVISTHRVAGPSGTTRYFTRFLGMTGGLESGSSMPAQTAVLVSKYSDTNTRSGRGRMYWPFINSTLVNSGQINNSALLTLDGKFELLLLEDMVNGGGNTMEPVVYSRTDTLGRVITDIVVRPVLAMQKRRVVYNQPPWDDA
jgi:hypothetical protein